MAVVGAGQRLVGAWQSRSQLLTLLYWSAVRRLGRRTRSVPQSGRVRRTALGCTPYEGDAVGRLASSGSIHSSGSR